MSKFAPQQSDNGGKGLQFMDMSIIVTPAVTKNGNSYFRLEFQMIPFFDPDNPPLDPKRLEIKKWYTHNGGWNKGFNEVFWPSVEAMKTAGLLKEIDDLFTSNHLVSCTRKKFLTQASQYDIDKGKFLEQDPATKIWMSQSYPVKLINIYPRHEEWEADAKKEAATQPVPQAQVAQPAQNIECNVILDSIRKNFLNQWLVLNEGGELVSLNVNKALLSVEPFLTYLPEIKQMVAEVIVAKVGPDENKLKGLLIDGFLDFHGPEITAALGEIPF